jgi:Uma2 family endonuclease
MMTSTQKRRYLSVEEYLAGELVSPVKHEYLGGVVYAMTGARNSHNVIAGNIQGMLYGRLRGKRCQSFNADTKIRIQYPTHVRFYYPDVSVTCRPNSQSQSFQDQPTVIVEVLSKSTRRTDEGEKRDAYFTIPTLSVYLLVEQASASVTVYRRREDGFARELYDGLDAVVALPEIECELPLGEIYERVEFVPEPEDEI